MTLRSNFNQPQIAGIWGPAPDRKDIMAPGYSYRQPVVPKGNEKPADRPAPTVAQVKGTPQPK